MEIYFKSIFFYLGISSPIYFKLFRVLNNNKIKDISNTAWSGLLKEVKNFDCRLYERWDIARHNLLLVVYSVKIWVLFQNCYFIIWYTVTYFVKVSDIIPASNKTL